MHLIHYYPFFILKSPSGGFRGLASAGFFLAILFSFLPVACSVLPVVPDEERDEMPPVFPDYAGCVIPPNIAPLNFELTIPYEDARVMFAAGTESRWVRAKRGQFTIPAAFWEKMLRENVGKDISVRVLAKANGRWTGYAPFTLSVAEEPVDPYIAYRLIEPGYELWAQMGLYQRNVETYRQTPIMENKLTGDNCMNCHSFCMQDPDRMLFHMRGQIACTMFMDGERIEKLNTKTDQTIAPLVYPSWHPSGQFVAFSVNDTKQAFHMNDPNRIEVYDLKSDVIVYDTEKHEIVTSRLLYGSDVYETFPTFSPDGRTLYFCSAEYVPEMPVEYDKVRYSLCSVSFDPDSRRFGTQADTLYNARTEGRSVSFPRVSPDGKYLMYTLADYGGFSIWHRDSDLYMINLSTGSHYPLTVANSDNVESYHSWSSNSRWVVFSSRRIDGLYTRPYFAYIDGEGQVGKPFLLPQKEVGFYHRLMYSYNIPEFIKGKVKDRRRTFAEKARNDRGIDVGFGEAQ